MQNMRCWVVIKGNVGDELKRGCMSKATTKTKATRFVARNDEKEETKTKTNSNGYLYYMLANSVEL
jgi:hypothetical protein